MGLTFSAIYRKANNKLYSQIYIYTYYIYFSESTNLFVIPVSEDTSFEETFLWSTTFHQNTCMALRKKGHLLLTWLKDMLLGEEVSFNDRDHCIGGRCTHECITKDRTKNNLPGTSYYTITQTAHTNMYHVNTVLL